MAGGEAGEIGADGRRRGRDRDKAMRGAPMGKMRPVGLVGTQRGCGGSLLGQRLGGSQAPPARAGVRAADPPGPAGVQAIGGVSMAANSPAATGIAAD